MGRMGPDAGRGAMRRALACRALRLGGQRRAAVSWPPARPRRTLPTAARSPGQGVQAHLTVGSPRPHPAAAAHLRIFRAGWLNHVATRRCQSLWKWGFRIMPFRLGAMAAAYGPGEPRERGASQAPGSGRTRRPARPQNPSHGPLPSAARARGPSAAAPDAALHRWRRMPPDAAKGAGIEHTHLLRRRTASGKELLPQSTLGWCWARPIKSAEAFRPVRAGDPGSDVHALPADLAAWADVAPPASRGLGPGPCWEDGGSCGTPRPSRRNGQARGEQRPFGCRVFPAPARHGTRYVPLTLKPRLRVRLCASPAC